MCLLKKKKNTSFKLDLKNAIQNYLQVSGKEKSKYPTQSYSFLSLDLDFIFEKYLSSLDNY